LTVKDDEVMTMASRIVVVLSLLSCLCGLVTGCSLGKLSGPAETQTATLSTMNIAGKVHGGQQPVSGATIQLYAANTTTNQGASTAMLTTTVTTAADGSFSITGDFTCPVSNPLVYIVATGGNPGLGGTVNNTDLTLMSLLGTCSSLSSSTYVVINELSTVASVEALSSFMSDATHMGSAPSNLVGIAGGFASASAILDLASGYFNGADLGLPEVLLNTLGNILAACVNSTGGVSGDSTPCGQLLSLSGGTDTVTAALGMVQSPGHNTAQLYALITATPPFQPYFTSVPTDFTASVGYNVPPNVRAAALDSNGYIWLYTGGYNYDTVTNMSTDTEGVITVYDNNFNEKFTISPGTGGLYYPTSMASDAAGNVYAMNANNTVSEFNSSGAAVSPSGGWPTGFTSTFTGTGTGNGYVISLSDAGPISADALGNIWVVGPLSTTIPPQTSPPCYAELNQSGSNITPASISAFCTAMSISEDSITSTDLFGFATDGSGSAWVLSEAAIGKVNASGALAATAPTNEGCFEPAIGVVNGNLNADVETLGLRYDHVNHQLWGYSETGAGTISDSGTAGFCDAASASMPFIAGYASTSTTPGAPYSAGSLLINSAVLDGAGNLWFTTGGVAATGTVGTTAGTFNGTVTYSAFLGELSPTGALLTPLNAATSTYGLQPAGLGANVTATSNGASILPEAESAGLLGVDSSGNIWALDSGTNKILKITGMATANTVNY
jgi:hypothetical protein